MLSTGEDVNILVLDTEMYSNTGGQKVGAGRSLLRLHAQWPKHEGGFVASQLVAS